MFKFSGQNTQKLDNFYINICYDIDNWLKTHTLFEYEKLIVTESNHPIIGLHSTTNSNLQDILENGFNNKSENAIIMGEMPDWPEAMFASPYLNGDKIKNTRNFKRSTNNYISFTNGINREIKRKTFKIFDKYGINMEKLLKKYPENYISFPMIIAAFKDESNKKIQIGSWISVYDPKKQVIILGIINVKFTFDEIIDKYELNKTNNFDVFTWDNEINYEITWFDNFVQNYVIVNYKNL